MERKMIAVCVGVAILALVLRVPWLGDVMTVDESNWMLRSAEFYNQLLEGDPGGTFLTTHPGSVPMWLIGAGEILQERRLGFEVHESNLLHFRKAALAPLIAAAAALIGLITYLLARVWPLAGATAAGVLIAAEPYLVGMTTITHLDGLQSLFMLASLVAFFGALHPRSFQVSLVMLAGVLWGAALGFKLILALWLLPVFVVITFFARRNEWSKVVRILGLVIGVAVFVFWLSWPALWVKDDVGRSLQRDYGSVVTEEHVALEEAEEAITAESFYVRTLLGRVTPYVQVLVIGCLVASSTYYVSALIRRRSYLIPSTEYMLLGWLFLYSLGFLLLITVAAKKADRYAMPALVVWPVIAGWVVGKAYEALSRKHWAAGSKRVVLHAALCLMLGALVAVPLLWAPYTVAYNNPFFPNIRPLSQQGWGEGLEAAAAWLNERPGAEQMYVASWYPSVMETYFTGKTLTLSSRGDSRVRYLVTYRNMEGRGDNTQATAVLEEVAGEEPVHVITIAGKPYASIYDLLNVSHFTRHVGELQGERTVGQTVRPEKDSWDSIEIGFATFSSRANTEDVIIHVRESSEAITDLRTTQINASHIIDNEWAKVMWEPLPNSRDREFYVLIESPASRVGNAVTVRFSSDDIRPGQMYINGQAQVGDIAYRLP